MRHIQGENLAFYWKERRGRGVVVGGCVAYSIKATSSPIVHMHVKDFSSTNTSGLDER